MIDEPDYMDYPIPNCKLPEMIQLAILMTKKNPCIGCNLDRKDCGSMIDVDGNPISEVCNKE